MACYFYLCTIESICNVFCNITVVLNFQCHSLCSSEIKTKKIMKETILFTRKPSKSWALLLFFQIIGFSIFAQSTYLSHQVYNNRSEQLDRNGNIKKSNNSALLYKENVTKRQQQSIATSWSSSGLIGGDIIDISICPDSSVIIFATGSKPYMSNDGGSTWSVIEALPSTISSICALPNGKILAGGGYTDVDYFMSNDYGQTWLENELSSNSSSGSVSVIEFDPSNPNIIFIGTSTIYGNTVSEVIFKSTDGGNTFNIAETDLLEPDAAIQDICIDPLNPDLIFAVALRGFSSSLVIVSIDGGENWNDCSNGLNTQRPFNSVSVYNGIVYLGGGHAYSDQFFGLFKSSNNGQAWQSVSSNFPSEIIEDVVILPEDPNIIYAATFDDGIYKSIDAGENWNFTNSELVGFSCNCIAIAPDNSQNIYAGFENQAIYKSEDSGLSFNMSSTGVNALYTTDIAVNQNNPSQVLVATESDNSGACYYTNNGGVTWDLIESLPYNRFSSVEIDKNGIFYAWANGPTSTNQEGLYKSTDSGVSWTNMGPNIGIYLETQIYDIEISTENPDFIVITGNNFGINGSKGVIYKSMDAGVSWDLAYISESDFESFKHASIVGSTIYSAKFSLNQPDVFHKSTDEGLNWTEITNGIPESFTRSSYIVADKNNADIVYGIAGELGNYYAVYKSINGGTNWNELNLLSDPLKPLSCLVLHPENSDELYVGSWDNSSPIFASENGGETWELANVGFPTTRPTSFSEMVNIDGNYFLYASTNSASVYVTQTNSSVDIRESDEFKGRIFPNPFKESVNVQFSLDQKTLVSLSVCNMNGKTVSTLIQEKERFGIQNISWDGHSDSGLKVPQGIYMFVLKTDQKKTYIKALKTF